MMMRYLAAGDVTLVQFAKDEKVSLTTVKRRSSTEGWVQLKTEMVQEAMEVARLKMISEMAGDTVARMRDWLNMADYLKARALETFEKKGLPMTTHEAIRAIHVAGQLEAKVLQPGKPGTALVPLDPDGAEGGVQLTQVNINTNDGTPQVAVSPMREVDVQELSDADLRQIIVDAEVVAPEEAPEPKRGSPGGVAAPRGQD